MKGVETMDKEIVDHASIVNKEMWCGGCSKKFRLNFLDLATAGFRYGLREPVCRECFGFCDVINWEMKLSKCERSIDIHAIGAARERYYSQFNLPGDGAVIVSRERTPLEIYIEVIGVHGESIEAYNRRFRVALDALKEQNQIDNFEAPSHWRLYRAWMEENAKLVKVVPHTAISSVVELLERFKNIPPQPKECYDNAARTAIFAEDDIMYVEGFAFHERPEPHVCRHAWNKKGDVHIDITYELACGFDISKISYLQVLSVPGRSKILFADNRITRGYETVMDAYYRTKILGRTGVRVRSMK